jgi:hypothetical protein
VQTCSSPHVAAHTVPTLSSPPPGPRQQRWPGQSSGPSHANTYPGPRHALAATHDGPPPKIGRQHTRPAERSQLVAPHATEPTPVAASSPWGVASGRGVVPPPSDPMLVLLHPSVIAAIAKTARDPTSRKGSKVTSKSDQCRQHGSKHSATRYTNRRAPIARRGVNTYSNACPAAATIASLRIGKVRRSRVGARPPTRHRRAGSASVATGPRSVSSVRSCRSRLPKWQRYHDGLEPRRQRGRRPRARRGADRGRRAQLRAHGVGRRVLLG